MNATPTRIEVYGSGHCAYTTELREHLQWLGDPFVEYDVEADGLAFERLQQLTNGGRAVPVLVENGVVKAVGWLGRTCLVDGPSRNHI